MSGVIFVSAFLDLGEDRSKDKCVETCFQHFSSLAQTGIQIHLFLSPCYKELYEAMHMHLEMENVVVEYVNLSDLHTYREIQDFIAYPRRGDLYPLKESKLHLHKSIHIYYY